MSTSPNTIAPTRIKQLAMLQKMLEGLKKHEQALPSLLIQGKPFKPADLIAELQTRLDAANAVLATRATWQNAVKVDSNQRTTTKGFVSGLRQTLLVAFAGSVDALADFGLVGRKPRVVTPEKKVAAAQKAKATRAARHTMGKKQKAQIKGSVPRPHRRLRRRPRRPRRPLHPRRRLPPRRLHRRTLPIRPPHRSCPSRCGSRRLGLRDRSGSRTRPPGPLASSRGGREACALSMTSKTQNPNQRIRRP